MKRPIPLLKLSQLQRLILVVLLEPRYSALKRREFRALIKLLYWGCGYPRATAAAVSLSRALSRLEGRGYLERTRSGWALRTIDPTNSGLMTALYAWQQKKELYLQV